MCPSRGVRRGALLRSVSENPCECSVRKILLTLKAFRACGFEGGKRVQNSTLDRCDEGDSPTILDSHTLSEILLFSQLSRSDWAGLSGYRCQLRLIKIDDAYHTVVLPCNLCLIACNLRQSIFPIITVSMCF